MLNGIWGMIKDNPTTAIVTLLGALLGGFGGAAMGGSMLMKVLLGVGLGAAGLAAGGYLGSYIQGKVEDSTPAPLGMKVVSTAPIEAGKAAEIDLKPTKKMVDAAKETFSDLLAEHKKNPDPMIQGLLEAYGVEAYADKIKYVPSTLLASALPPITLKGTATPDGTALVVDMITVDMNRSSDLVKSLAGSENLKTVSFKPKPVRVPLKDGKLDENHPDTKAAMQDVVRQAISMVMPEYQDRATAAADKMFGKMGMDPLVKNVTPTDKPSNDPKKIAAVGDRAGEKMIPGVGAVGGGMPAGMPLPGVGGKPAEGSVPGKE